jgi:hypothetical protein
LTAAKVVANVASGYAYKGITLTEGVYTFSLYVKASASTTIAINFDTTTSSKNITTEWQRFDVTHNVTSAGTKYVVYAGLATGVDYFVWGAQTNIGSTAKPYFPTTDRLNVPRLTYQNGGGGCPSLLLEKQSTNYARNWDFTAAIWNKNAITVVSNSGTSPDGTNNAFLFYPISSGTDRFLYDDQGSASYTANADYTTTVYAKASGLNFAYIRFEDKSNTSSYVYFNLSTGAVGSTTGSVTIISKTIEAMGNGWYRLRVTANMGTGTGGKNNVLFGVADADGSTQATTSGTNGVLFYGPQSEQSSYPTSPIQTSGASATRVADACFKTGISSLFGTNQGTFFMDFLYLSSDVDGYLFDVTATSGSQRFLMYSQNGGNAYVLFDSIVGAIASYQLTKGQRYKIAVKYNSTATSWYINGSLVATGGAFGYQMVQIYLNQRYSQTDFSQMQVNQTIVFPTALTNAELASLTTL